jgi:transposase InsO family protein
VNEAADPVQERRQFAARATEQGLSQRRACRLAHVARSSARYQAHPRDERADAQALKEQMQRVRQKHPRFGIRRAHALLSAQAAASGLRINHKRVQRLWRECGFQVPQRPKKRKLKVERPVPCQAERPDHVWSYDFQEDGPLSGRKMRLLNIIDEFTREWLSVTVGVSLTSQAVIAALVPLFASRCTPAFVRSDNGPEFIADEVKAWLGQNGSAPFYIDPGSPWQNGFVESSHGKLRDELLDREAFASVAEARVHLQTHRRWYNEERPHSSLKYTPPVVFRQAWQQSQRRSQEEDKPPG